MLRLDGLRSCFTRGSLSLIWSDFIIKLSGGVILTKRAYAPKQATSRDQSLCGSLGVRGPLTRRSLVNQARPSASTLSALKRGGPRLVGTLVAQVLEKLPLVLAGGEVKVDVERGALTGILVDSPRHSRSHHAVTSRSSRVVMTLHALGELDQTSSPTVDSSCA